MLASLPAPPTPDDQHRLRRQIDHPRTSLPALLRQVVLEMPGKGQQKRHRVGGEMLVVAAVHAGNDNIALDQRIVEPRAAQAYAWRRYPARDAQIQRSLFARAKSSGGTVP